LESQLNGSPSIFFKFIYSIYLHIFYFFLVPTEDKIQGNRKKQKTKKKAAQDTPFPLQPVDPGQSKTLYTTAVGRWASNGGDWPKGLPYGTDDQGDQKVVSGPGDEVLVEVLAKDQFGNHSMLKVRFLLGPRFASPGSYFTKKVREQPKFQEGGVMVYYNQAKICTMTETKKTVL